MDGTAQEGYLRMSKEMATYIGGLGAFGATFAGWAITSHLVWLAVGSAILAAVLGGLAFSVGVNARPTTKHAAFVSGILLGLLAGLVVHRMAVVPVAENTVSTSGAAQKTVNNKAESDGDEAPAIAGGTGNTVTYSSGAPTGRAGRAKKQ